LRRFTKIDLPPGPENQEEKVDTEPLVQYEDLEQATGFTQVSNAVLRCFPELSDGEKLTYVVLKSFAYVGPETFVGEETLAKARGVSVRSVSRHLQRLIDAGLVKVRRRGQGRTNLWIIARLPQEKLVTYLGKWRPNIEIRQNCLTKTRQDWPIKTGQDWRIEEQKNEEPKLNKTKQGRRSTTGSPSTNAYTPSTTQQPTSNSAPRGEAAVETPAHFSTVSTDVENLAALVAEHFGATSQQRSIATFLSGYDPAVVRAALETVLRRLERGDPIQKPIAYFYTVVKVMQADHDAVDQERAQDEVEKRAIAMSWARSLLREWPLEQARAILIDTYTDPEFADEILREATE